MKIREMNKDLVIAKQREYINYLLSAFYTTHEKEPIIELFESELSALEVEPDPPYEPYFGWCDVEGCDNEGASGGCEWKETGYWTLCMDHSSQARKGVPQPPMKQSAIDRENSRDPKTGWLPSNTTK